MNPQLHPEAAFNGLVTHSRAEDPTQGGHAGGEGHGGREAQHLPGAADVPVQAALIGVGGGGAVLRAVRAGVRRVATNPSILPRDYGAGLAVILAAVCVTAALVVALRWRRGRGR